MLKKASQVSIEEPFYNAVVGPDPEGRPSRLRRPAKARGRGARLVSSRWAAPYFLGLLHRALA